jgi:hypothetical protein
VKHPRPIHIVLAAVAALGIAIGVLAAVGGGGSSSESSSTPVVTPAPSARLPRDFFGIVTEDAFAREGSYRDKTLNQQARIGVGLVRQTFDWAQIERAPGRYDFSGYDGFVASLAVRRMRVLPVLLDPPRFRSARPAGSTRVGTWPPRNDADIGRFAAALVRRYGPHGTLWRDRPDLPKVPVRSWQVWNEPSLPVYWSSGPSPGRYARMLKAVSGAIKRVDPNAEVVTGGLPESRLGIPFDRFLRGMYRAGAAPAFDVLAIHPYAQDDSGVLSAVEQARRIMDANGDRSPIWVTELGWASAGPPSPFTVGQRGQAARIVRTFTELADMRSKLRLRGVVYFGWRDGSPYPPQFKDFWGLHTGLLTVHETPKLALATFGQTVAKLRRQGPGG